MNFVLLIDGFGAGGAQRQIVNLAIELKSLGHDVKFVRYVNDDFYLPLLKKAEIEVLTVKSTNSFSRIFKIRKSIKRLNPDIVISFMGTPNFYASVSSVGSHKWKLIVSERIAREQLFLQKKSKLFRDIQARYADAIVCNSRCAEDLWKKYYPKTHNRLSTIYNIVDIPVVDNDYERQDKCRVVIAARYEKEKNLDGVLRAVSLLSEEEQKQIHIDWYGRAFVDDSPVYDYAEGLKYIEEKHLDCISLHPETNQIYTLMAKCDYVALFSHMEGLPNAIIEGMTLGKPIIMTRVSDYDVLVDSSNGFLCDPNSPQDIANTLRAAINTTYEEKKRMGEESYNKISKICSRKKVIEQWMQLINHLNSEK